MGDGSTCAMTQATFGTILWGLADPNYPPFAGREEDQRKVFPRFYRFETFRVDGEQKHMEFLKGPFTVHMEAHLFPPKGFMRVASTSVDWRIFHYEGNGNIKNSDEYFRLGAWGVRFGPLGYKTDPPFQDVKYYVAWTCVTPTIDTDNRYGQSYIEVGVNEEDFNRIIAVIQKDSKKIKDVMTGILPELQAMSGMGIGNTGVIEIVDERKKRGNAPPDDEFPLREPPPPPD